MIGKMVMTYDPSCAKPGTWMAPANSDGIGQSWEFRKVCSTSSCTYNPNAYYIMARDWDSTKCKDRALIAPPDCFSRSSQSVTRSDYADYTDYSPPGPGDSPDYADYEQDLKCESNGSPRLGDSSYTFLTLWILEGTFPNYMIWNEARKKSRSDAYLVSSSQSHSRVLLSARSGSTFKVVNAPKPKPSSKPKPKPSQKPKPKPSQKPKPKPSQKPGKG